MVMKLVLEIKEKAGREEQLAMAWARRHGYPVLLASVKQIQRKKVLLTKFTILVGSVAFVRAALQQLGRELPDYTPYPEALRLYFHRQIWKVDSLRQVKEMLDVGRRLFVKPVDGWKRFAGFVPEFSDDYRFNDISQRIPMWVSEPVEFVSEWRAYVVEDQLMDLQLCDFGGDETIKPDRDVIIDAIGRLEKAGAPAAYVIDFGVLSTGETALVEMNDGFAFDAYGDVLPDVYMGITQVRWYQRMLESWPDEAPSVFIDLHMPRGGEDGVIVATRSDGAKVEFRGKPYSQWDVGENSPMYRLHASLVRVNISTLHCSEVENVSAWHEEWPIVNAMFEAALQDVFKDD